VGKIIPDLILCKLAEGLEATYYNRKETQSNRPSDITGSRNCFFLMMKLGEPGEPNLIAASISFNMCKYTFEATKVQILPVCTVLNVFCI